MEAVRKPFQGIGNIIRFNWHYYFIAFVIISSIYLAFFFIFSLPAWGFIICFLLLVAVLTSLLVSYYIYDLSGFYRLDWLNELALSPQTILNIHAGFDETSSILKRKFPSASLMVYDFFNPAVHTEVSIKRARKTYPAFPGTLRISTDNIPAKPISTDLVFLIFAAHEIRNDEERIVFFKELGKVLKDNGKIIIVEHMQDLPNFLAYTVGFFHFLKKSTWLKTISKSGLAIEKLKKINPFVKLIILEKDGTSN